MGSIPPPPGALLTLLLLRLLTEFRVFSDAVYLYPVIICLQLEMSIWRLDERLNDSLLKVDSL